LLFFTEFNGQVFRAKPIVENYYTRSQKMTLLISNEDAEQILSITDCIDALEQMYGELADSRAVSGHRSDMVTETAHESGTYSLKMMGGVIPKFEVGAVRINSDLLGYPESGGIKRRVKIPAAPGDRWVGLVLLFSTRTGEPLAIFPDGVVQHMRVAGTSALGVKYMARENAKTVALLGAGWQAAAQIPAMAAVRNIEEFRVYGPTPERREKLCVEMEQKTGIKMRPMSDPQSAVKDADIVLCATNSMTTVFYKEWLEPGMHVGAIRNVEIEAAAINAADRVAIHDPSGLTSGYVLRTKGMALGDGKKQSADDPALKHLADAPILADLVSGNVQGRTNETEISQFLNYQGLGIQFAAAGWALYQKAKEHGRGRDLPTDWFTEDVIP
jgi:alanine dehydrogenase